MFGKAAAMLKQVDPEISSILLEEAYRQERQIELIASENFVSPAVLAAAGSVPYQQICRRLSSQALLRWL